MGEKAKEALKLQFDKRLRLEFHGTRITSADQALQPDALGISLVSRPKRDEVDLLRVDMGNPG